MGEIRGTLDELELRTQEYSVLITDEKHASCGSGVLFYPGLGEVFYVFTCAHVIDKLNDPLVIKLLLPQQRELENYSTCTIKVDRNQVVYSPIDVVTGDGECKEHSVDVAVIYIKKDMRLNLSASDYCIAEASRGMHVFAQGFPGGMRHVEELLEALDVTHGKILHNVPRRATFVFRVEDDYLDAGQREQELKGFSGSPVWNSEDAELSMLGLMSSGVGENIFRSRVNAVKMEYVRCIMESHFNVHIDTRIAGIPESEIAGKSEHLVFDGTITMDPPENVYDQWLMAQTEKVCAYISDLKMQKAIDLAEETIHNHFFDKCSSDLAVKHFKYLLYCYEITLLDDEFEKTEKCMQERNLLKGHDPLRQMTFTFCRKEYAQTITIAKDVMEMGSSDVTLAVVTEMFAEICRAYTEDAPVDETILKFLDNNENLIVEVRDPECQSLVYQMLGYVYGNHYKEYTKSVRCLNRAYQMGHDSMVLESLGCAYYFLSLQNATGENNFVDIAKVNRAELYKARECFLLILGKADELMLSATMKRVGMVIYETFYFLKDSYRVITLYPKVKENVQFQSKSVKRHFELKYAEMMCEGGVVDFAQFDALEKEDIEKLELLGKIRSFGLQFRNVNSQQLSGNAALSNTLRSLINAAEQWISRTDGNEKLSFAIELINMYGFGHRCFGWAVSGEIERHLQYVRSVGNTKLITTLENFLFENSHSLEEAEENYLEAWNSGASIEMWRELLNFYIRNGMLDKADVLYEQLFGKHRALIEDEPEYACRGYFQYTLENGRNIKNALRIYVDHQNELIDANLREFWKHELMTYTCAFNEPEEFEEERESFVQQGLIPEDEYHRVILVAYMLNLNSKKAWEHFSEDNPYFGVNIREPGTIPHLTREGACFLVWQKKYPPGKEMGWNGIVEKNVKAVCDRINAETWHREIADIKEQVNFKLERTIAIDAWGIYLIAVEGNLDTLERFDCVYVTHPGISRMLEEMCHYENLYFTSALAYFEGLDNVRIVSPDFEYQLLVREVQTNYYESCSTIALALEKQCIAVIGDPYLQKETIDKYKDIIVRPCDYNQLLT